MTAKFKNVLGWVLLVIGLGLAWYGLASANDYVFQQLALNPNAHLIYLPAALRIIYPLVFREAGVFGIIIGSYLVIQDRVNDGLRLSDGLLEIVSLSVMSSLAPLIGIAIFKMLFTTKPDLADLKTVHFFALGSLCASSNALLHNLYYTLSGHAVLPLELASTIFIGDIAGTVIVLSLLSFVLTFFISRRRV